MSNKVEFPNDASEFVYMRTYSRWIEEAGRRESWDETVDRYINFLKKHHGEKVPPKVFRKVKQYLLEFSTVGSMRAIWAAGEAAESTNVTLYNCAYSNIDCIDIFAECLYILMCGTGFGFSVQKRHVEKLPVIKEFQGAGAGTFIIPDSKEGWADSVKHLMTALYSGRDMEMDYSLLRDKGARLKTFGGRSSGPAPLISLHEFMRKIFTEAQGRHLKPIECLDILNKIAEIVVVGGVRRSSEISLSDLDDKEMELAKNWPFPLHRAMSNNSVVYHEKPGALVFMREWSNLANSGSGERGIFNLEGAKKRAPERRDSTKLEGANPCAEILLRSCQFCNLSEVVIRREDDLDDILDKIEAATWLGAIQSCFIDFPYLNPKWKRNCKEERLLGVSLTGQMDNYEIMSNETMAKAMKARALKVSKRASKILGINFSTSITCVKPSGCQKKDTILLTSKGILTLGEIGDTKGDQWQNHDISVMSQDENKKSTKFYVNGKAKTKKIHMKSGTILEATNNHQYKILSKNGLTWSRVDELRVGDIVPYRIGGYEFGEDQILYKVDRPYCNVKQIKQPKVLCEKLSYILGLYAGDGSNHAGGIRISGNASDIEPIEKAKMYAKEIFGIDGIIYKRTNGNNADLYLNSTWLNAFLLANNLSKSKTHNVDIPLSIRKSTPSVISAFIDGYCDADGHITKRGERIFCTTSKKMSEQLPIVLRALGSVCSVRLMPPTSTSFGDRMRYRITVNKGWDGDYMKSGLGRHYKDLEKIGLKNQYVPDVIEFIEESERETFDIEVPDSNRYIANSYISHNTVSQLTNSASGLHTRFSDYYIRRYRISSIDPLFKMMKAQGVPMCPENGQRKGDWKAAQEGDITASTIYEKGKRWSEDKVNTWVISFPIKSPEGSKTRDDLTAIEQLEYYKHIQENWCEHNASATIYVKDDEWLSVGNWVYENWKFITGVSFLPFDNGNYEQAPYEKITKSQFEKMSKDFVKIDYSELSKFELEDHTIGSGEIACGGGSCDV